MNAQHCYNITLSTDAVYACTVQYVQLKQKYFAYQEPPQWPIVLKL